MNKNYQDIRNLLSKNFTYKRVLNASKVISSYYVSKLLKKPVQWGRPIAFSVEPTTSCNLRCPQCPSGLRSFSRPTGMLLQPVFERIIEELSPTTGYVTLYFQGEPYLNTKFLDMVAFANRFNIYTATSTNAHYLTAENSKKTIESGLDRLIISIDGVSQDTYGKYRIGGQLEKVLEGTKNLVQAKKEMKSSTPHIIWQFIVFKHNEHELNAIKELAKTYGVDELAIKSAQIYDYENGNDLMPENEAFSRYKKDENSYAFKNKLLNHCWRLWHSCVITWDGKVVPCCFDKDGTYQLGNLSDQSFGEIWQSEPYQNFRKQILKGRQYIEICKNCSEGTSVWQN
ncbi:MAG: SPASM domain-containing protein [bacterium]|nr:SPASM domain-containing protein [bacterium]